MSTVVWLPVGLLLIDRVLRRLPRPAAKPTAARRALLLATLGLVFANQVLAGFPQSAYICGLVYGSFALFRALSGTTAARSGRDVAACARRDRAARWCSAPPRARSCSCRCRSSAASRIAPGRSATSGRRYTNFWPPNILTFFVPYINGDMSDKTYIGPPSFWENYGYVGVATALLAIYGAVRERRRPLVMFLIVMTLIAFVFVLGPRDAGLLRRLRADSGHEEVSLADALPGRRGAGTGAAGRHRPDAGAAPS